MATTELKGITTQDKHNERVVFKISMWLDNNGEPCSTTMLIPEFTENICEIIVWLARHRDKFGKTLLEEMSQLLTDTIMEELK